MSIIYPPQLKSRRSWIELIPALFSNDLRNNQTWVAPLSYFGPLICKKLCHRTIIKVLGITHYIKYITDIQNQVYIRLKYNIKYIIKVLYDISKLHWSVVKSVRWPQLVLCYEWISPNKESRNWSTKYVLKWTELEKTPPGHQVERCYISDNRHVAKRSSVFQRGLKALPIHSKDGLSATSHGKPT